MKKLLLILFISVSQLCFSQEKKSEPTINFKNIKIGVACSGGFLLAGTITNVVRTYQIEPDVNMYVDSKKYDADYLKYKQKQNDFHRVSSMFYGFAAVSLISICFNF